MANRTWLYSSACALLTLCAAGTVGATNVNITGLFNGKAMVSINGSPPKIIAVGEKATDGVKLLSADSNAATFEIDGRRQTLSLGQGISTGDSASSGNPTVTLTADSQGHFFTLGSVNGAPTQFLVDTGASSVVMSAAQARNLGIPYLQGKRGYSSTANGIVPIYSVTFDTVRIGDITLHQVAGAVIEGNGLSVALLGMSFLKRVQMKREGITMTLTKQY